MKHFFYYLLIVLFISACKKADNESLVYKSKSLLIKQVAENTYIHTSFLKTQSFGNVPCNGMFVKNNSEVVVFDTPVNDTVANELINWIRKTQNASIKAVVVTHFHNDCLGGLKEFHKAKIPSFATNKTTLLAKQTNKIIPQNSFTDSLALNVGNKKVFAFYMGEGHTQDNCIGYFPTDKSLFGGCLIKAKGASKGNLEDANVTEWSKTVLAIKHKFTDVKHIIPGHGKHGSTELLNYTITLFKPNN